MKNVELEIPINSLASKLGFLMREKGLNIPNLAKRTGIALGTIQKILTDPNSNPTYSTLKAISEALDISIGVLLNEKITLHEHTTKVSVITWADIMNFLSGSHGITPLYIGSCVISNLDLNHQAFAIKLTGGGIPPFFKENSILIFDPNKIPSNCSFVLVKFYDHEKPSFKQLIIDEPSYYIKSVNPELVNENIQQLRAKDKIIATLVQSLSNFS